MKQKFLIGSRVKIADAMPRSMSHFTKGVEAIVNGTYAQKYHGRNYSDYSLGIIKDGKIYNFSAWYPENLLTLVDDDTIKGMEMLEEYKEDTT
jgi:hypothetical protein